MVGPVGHVLIPSFFGQETKTSQVAYDTAFVDKVSWELSSEILSDQWNVQPSLLALLLFMERVFFTEL